MARITSVVLALTATVSAQSGAPGWVPPSSVRPAAQTGMVYDEARGRLVLYGGAKYGGVGYNDLWEWDGSTWVWRRPIASPPAWEGAGMAYDSARQRTVLFGGRTANTGSSGAITNETWEWDGFAWVERTPASSPPPRNRHATAYDEARQRLVLFGGNVTSAGTQPSGDTWEWDGASWTQLNPAQSPDARQDHAMVYDRARGVVLLFGGRQDGFPSSEFGDTWEWDGTGWTQLAPAATPGERYGHSMTYDSVRQRVVLFGGEDRVGLSTVSMQDTWEWDGSTWILRAQNTGPEAEILHGMAYDPGRQRTVVFGGRDQGRPRGETWEWDGVTWTLRTAPPPEPPAPEAVLAFDAARQRTFMFGPGAQPLSANTWEFDGTAWQQLAPATSPPARTQFAMVADSARQRIVLFGGSPTLADTWEWDGSTWSRRQPAVSPPGRGGHGMAYDGARGRVVMFGGLGVGYQDDTWTWDGANWQQQDPATRPSERLGIGMAYDPDRQRVVLFGGLRIQTNYADTWEWDGVTWRRMSPPVSPSARAYPAMTWDGARRRVVLFGGRTFSSSGNVTHDDTWEWDGTSWTRVERAGPRPVPRMKAGIAFDENLQRTVLFGGLASSGQLFGTWTYGSGLADTQSSGVGCPGTLGLPHLGSFEPAALGRQSFALDLVRARPAAPAVLIVAAAPGNLSLAGDCALLVDPTTPWLTLPATISAAGTASFPLPIPPVASLSGQTVWGQAAIVDPAGVWLGLTFSDAVAVTLGL